MKVLTVIRTAEQTQVKGDRKGEIFGYIVGTGPVVSVQTSRRKVREKKSIFISFDKFLRE